MQMGFWGKFSLSIFWLAHLFVWKYLPFFPFQRQGEKVHGLLVSLAVLCKQGIWAGFQPSPVTIEIQQKGRLENHSWDQGTVAFTRRVGKIIAPLTKPLLLSFNTRHSKLTGNSFRKKSQPPTAQNQQSCFHLHPYRVGLCLGILNSSTLSKCILKEAEQNN